MPKLKVFGTLEPYERNIVFSKIVNGAPNLKKLTGTFNISNVDLVPREKYSLLDTFPLWISTHEHERKLLEVAEAGLALSKLFVNAPTGGEDERVGSFLRILGQVLTTSCNTLEEMLMKTSLFPLNIVRFPALVNLKRLDIIAWGEPE